MSTDCICPPTSEETCQGDNCPRALCRVGISGPSAIEIARQMSVGTGDVGKLQMQGLCTEDSKTLAAAITSAGSH